MPTVQEPVDSYTYDPLHPVPTAGGAMSGPAAGIARQNDIEGRHDVLVYTTPSLNEDVEVTGPYLADPVCLDDCSEYGLQCQAGGRSPGRLGLQYL